MNLEQPLFYPWVDRVKRGQHLTFEGQTGHRAFVIQAGWACNYKWLRDAGRQIISFPIAGDIVGLRSVLLRTTDLSAFTDAVVNPVRNHSDRRLAARFAISAVRCVDDRYHGPGVQDILERAFSG